jgi:hypothetical protein
MPQGDPIARIVPTNRGLTRFRCASWLRGVFGLDFAETLPGSLKNGL